MVKKEKKVTRIDPVRTTQPLEQTQEKRVCAYCRISTDSEDQKHSLEAQVAYYSRLIGERNNWIFSGIYADEDRSGTKLNGRDEFQKMMQDCRRGQHDYIITKSVTRFARNTVDSIQAIRELKAIEKAELHVAAGPGGRQYWLCCFYRKAEPAGFRIGNANP